MNPILFTLFLSLTFSSLVSMGQTSMLDLTFGNGGLVTTPFVIPGQRVQVSAAYSVIVQPDNKIIAAGSAAGVTGTTIAVIRYLPNGSLDNTFGQGGKVSTLIGNSCYATSVALQPDGKIIVGGSLEPFSTGDFIIARYLSNGSLDNTFGTNGIVTTDFGSSYDYISSIIVQSDGNILAIGQHFTATSGNFPNYGLAMSRYNIAGNLDKSFGINGKVTFDDLNGNGKSADIQEDKKIVVGGTKMSGSTNNYNIFHAVARFNFNGTLDNTFGNNGIATTDLHNNNISFIPPSTLGTKILANGKIITGAYANGLAECKYCNNYALVQYNSNGTADNSFGNNGIVITDILLGKEETTSCIAINQNKIILGGWIDSTSVNDDFAIVRYNMNGTVDNSFGTNGIVITDFKLKVDDYLNSIAIQPDNKIVAAGINYTNDIQFALARYNWDNGVAPVIFEDIEVEKQNDKLLLEWKVENEINIKSYEIEKSIDGFHYTKVASISATNMPTYVWQYNWIDSIPNPINFYRIKSIGVAGEIIYSKTIKETFKSQFRKIVIYPNPTKNQFTVSYELDQKSLVDISIFDMNGKKIKQIIDKQIQLKGKHNINVNLDKHFAGGNYILHLKNNIEKYNIEFIIQ